jgi:pSer/pThr/pTyr-binding forkhead associated (FHA) protein
VDTSFGKIVLLNPNGPEQEFILAKSKVSIGRATTNDIIISDVRVSRNHARLEYSSKGLTLVDLNSSNGTRVNGIHIEKATLKPDDTISLGSHQLKYQVEDASEDPGLTVIDSEVELNQTLNNEYLPKVINETNTPSLVVFTGDKTWNIDLEYADQIQIGRDESCDIFIDAFKVSRRHAEVQRKGDVFLLKDLGSTNGTFLSGKKVDQHILTDGDVFRIGPAQIIYKSGFQEQALSLADEQIAKSTDRKTVIFVPGLMGSELWLGNERIWPNVKTLFTNPEIYKFPFEIPLEPRNIVNEVVIVPNLIKQDQYNQLGDYMVDELNYTRGVDFFEFPYDWRQDVRISAQQLGQLVESLSSTHPIVIISHSLGTMVSRYYIERLGGHKHIERIILMGGVHKGSVKGLTSMLIAPELLPFGIMGERLRKVGITWPTSYQIIPDYVVGHDQHGRGYNFIEDSTWLEPEYHTLLKLGREFRKELSDSAKIPSVCIFGYGIKTTSEVFIHLDDAGNIQNVDYLTKNIGDGSVLEESAFLPGSEIHPVHQHHGALFVDNDVKMRLKMELTQDLRKL